VDGRGVERNPTFASNFFSRVCERGNAEACLELANLYDRGEGVKKDATRAMGLYTKACQLGLGEACVTADPKGEVDAAPPRE
jgi:TPR repeat protein